LNSSAFSQPDSSLWQSLRIQLRVLAALLLREIVTRYGRKNLGFLWLFMEPMIFTVGVTALWSIAGMRHVSAIPIVAFAVTGYSAVLLWRNCASRCVMAINPNLGLLYHRNVRVLDLFLARILLEIAGATVSFVVLSGLWLSLGWMEPPVDLMTVFLGWFLLGWFGGALALVLGSLTAYSRVWERLWHPVAYILFPLSGALYMVDWLPPNLQKGALWIPMVHGTELLRDGFFGPVIRTHYNVEYFVLFCTGLTLLGLAMTRTASQRVDFEE
jgi:capsular polysaccharide transport system permease protein